MADAELEMRISRILHIGKCLECLFAILFENQAKQVKGIKFFGGVANYSFDGRTDIGDASIEPYLVNDIIDGFNHIPEPAIEAIRRGNRSL